MKTECIEHPNKPEKNGYVRCRHNGKKYFAHRLAYSIKNGPILPGYEIDHLCKNKRCCNPDHLEQVTPTANKRRSDCPSGINFRKTHCLNGHEFNFENTRIHKGQRHCRACKTARKKRP